MSLRQMRGSAMRSVFRYSVFSILVSVPLGLAQNSDTSRPSTQSWMDMVPKEFTDRSPFLKPITWQDGYLDTLQAACGASPFPETWTDKIIPHEEHIRFPNLNLLKRPLRTSVYYQRNTEGKIRAAELFVLLPGIFSRTFDDTTAFVATMLHQLGFHVLVIPNAWSTDLASFVTRPMGDMFYEVEIVLQHVKYFQKELRARDQLRDSTHIMGMSYGSFLAAMTKAIDLEQAQTHNTAPLLNGRLIAASPPFHFETSLQRLDAAIDSIEAKHTSGFQLLQRYKEICRELQNRAEPYRGNAKGLKLAQDNAKLIITRYSFHHPLQHAVRNYDVANGFGFRPGPHLGAGWVALEDAWRSQIRFENYFRIYYPNNHRTAGDDVWFKSWYRRIRALSNDPITIVTAKTDFINDASTAPWIDFDPRDIAVLESGGHGGYGPHPWTAELVKMLFGM